MATFSLSFTCDIHSHSPTAHRFFIGQMLQNVRQVVGSGNATEGKIEVPAGDTVQVIGSWKINDREGC